MTFSHNGVFESSKSASHTFAPEFKALMVIFRSVGPVISTRRSFKPGAAGATFQLLSSRIALVCGRKSKSSPSAMCCMRTLRAAISSKRRGLSVRCSSAMRSSACGVRISCERGTEVPITSTPDIN